MTPRAVLWDLDGTLVDSEDYHWRSWRDAMAAEGIDLSYDRFLASFGLRNDRILRGWLGDSVDPARIQQIGDAKEAEYRRLAEREGLTPLPGAAEWTARLHADGWHQAIASSAPRLNVEVMLRVLHLDRYFNAIAAAEDVTIGKPDPQVFLRAAEHLGVPPSRCIVVEDAPAGIEAARAGGMRSIGVSQTKQLDADIFVRALDALPKDAFDRLVAR
ncbi:MAG TPA: HAD family phosphatase [Vicinamibacterales bacterium]|nr:HAD family phosphatase [Vicinamibacterales bacterium]